MSIEMIDASDCFEIGSKSALRPARPLGPGCLQDKRYRSEQLNKGGGLILQAPASLIVAVNVPLFMASFIWDR